MRTFVEVVGGVLAQPPVKVALVDDDVIGELESLVDDQL